MLLLIVFFFFLSSAGSTYSVLSTMPSDSESSSSLSSVGMSEFRLPPLTPRTHCCHALLACECVGCICKSFKLDWRLRWTVIMGVGGHDRSIWRPSPVLLVWCKWRMCSEAELTVVQMTWQIHCAKDCQQMTLWRIPIMPSLCLSLMRSNVGLRRWGQQKACSVSCD